MSTSWQKIRLKFLAPSSRELLASRPEGIRYLGLENIESGTGKLLLETEQEQVDSSVVTFDEESVLFGKLRPYLAKVAAPDFKGVASTEIMALKPVGSNNRRFLAYSLLSDEFIKRVSGMTDGAKMPRANPNDVLNLSLRVPPIGIQSRIASHLDAQTAKIDRLMDMRRRQIALLQEQKAALLQQAVTQGLTPNVPMKDSGVSWLGEIPAHWEVFTLGRLATVLQTGPFGSQLHAHEYISGGIPVLNPSHMTEAGTILHDPDCSVDDATASRLTRHQLQQGDIIFARRGEIGRCALVDADQSGWICGTGSMLMRPNQTLVTSEYLTLIFQFKHLKESLSLHSVGSTMDNLNTGILARVRLPLPTVEEQLWILNQIKNSQQQFDNIINSYLRQLTLLAEYRAALIQECVTGQREVPDMPSPLVEEAHAL